MKQLSAAILAAEARCHHSKILLSQHYGEFSGALKSAATSKTSFFATLLGGAAFGYFSGGGGFASKAKNRFSGGGSFSWTNSILKVLFPYITGSLLGMLQTFLNRRTAKEEPAPQSEQTEYHPK